METDTLVVGGGLSGLYLAHRLAREGQAFHLLEARDRFGGRILGASKTGYDMGPAWFWPGQPRVERLIGSLGLRPFEQYAHGTLVFEDEVGRVRRDLTFAPMAGSLRVSGGFSALIDALVDTVPPEDRTLNCCVTQVSMRGAGQQVDVRCVDGSGDERITRCNRVILAIPPRLAAERIVYSPELPPSALNAMRGIYTWMAGHGKAMAVYDTPFWRKMGLSGDAMSHRGPLGEIHDASPIADECGEGALFGFFAVPASMRRRMQADGTLEHAVRDQLVRLFGPDAAHPTALHIKDWAADSFTATVEDAAPPPGHPAYGMPPELHPLWDGALVLSSSEVAREYGGFLEGALEAAESTFDLVLSSLPAARKA